MTVHDGGHARKRNDEALAAFGIGRLFWLTHEAIIAADLDAQTICLWNPAAERIFGYGADDALDMPLDKLVPGELVDAHHEGIRRYAGGAPAVLVGCHPVEVPAVRKDGERLTVALTLTALDDGSGRRYVVAVVRDVTAQRAAEHELRRANEAMRSFVASASHDLRTPLAVIIGFARTLEAHPEWFAGEHAIGAVAAIGRAGGQAARLVDDLLTLSKIHVGAIEAVPERVDLGEVVRDAAHDAAVEPVIDVGSTVVVTDRDHIHRMLVNLLSNASRYGKPPIEVTAEQRADVVDIRVRDHGAGIATDRRDRLFVAFADVGARDAKGTGLGLSIVRGLAEANRGTAFFEPTDTGACFGISLPSA